MAVRIYENKFNGIQYFAQTFMFCLEDLDWILIIVGM